MISGLYLFGPGDQGILYEHREKEFGDHFDRNELLEALSKIPDIVKTEE